MDPTVKTNDNPGSEESSSSDREIRSDLGEYRLLKRLGGGGMGHVYKAMHRRLEKLVALKTLPSYHASNPRALARFNREIKAAGRLNDPHVVQAFDAQEIDGTLFLVMEYVDGVDLSSLVRQCGALRISDACELTRQAALGLQAAHEHGLIHRDVKPSNLILSRRGQLKILDLGLARFRSEPLEAGEMTAINETIGTAEYIAPEQVADSHQVDIRADIYSLGCTLFRLLIGQPPFFGPNYRTAVEKMVAHLKEDVPPIRQLRQEIPESLAAVIARMVARDPEHRFAIPQEVADALAPFAAQCELLELIKQADAETQARSMSEQSLDSSPAISQRAGPIAEAGECQMPLSPPGEDSTSQEGFLLQRFWTKSQAVPATIAGLLLVVVLAGLGNRLWTTATRVRTNSPPPPVTAAAIDVAGKPLPQETWIDFLPYADLDRDRISDLWVQRSDGLGCRGASGYPRMMLPVTVEGNYDLEVRFTRISGNGPVVIIAPLGDKNAIDFILSGNAGDVHGFNSYNGHDLQDPDNPSAKRPGNLENEKKHVFLIQIRLDGDQATIDAALDGAALTHCKAAISAFPAARQTGCAEPKRPALGVHVGVDATFHSARIRLAGGKGAIKPPRPKVPIPPGQWVDLLARIDLLRDRQGGKLRRNGSGLVLSDDGTEARLMLPVAVRGNYELETVFTHRPTTGIISFILPVDLRRVRINPNHPGDLLASPSWINQPKATSGGDPPRVLEEGRTYVMLVKVTVDGDDAEIEIRVDGKPWMSWSGRPTELHDGPILLPEPDRVGLLASGTLTVASVRLRLNSGKGLLLPAKPSIKDAAQQ